MTFTLSYDETVAITGGDPFVILKIGDRIRLAEKETHTDANINFSYTVKNSDFDDNGIEITATTGLSRADFTCEYLGRWRNNNSVSSRRGRQCSLYD